jgi:cell wall-associated NlpC family hydrolase
MRYKTPPLPDPEPGTVDPDAFVNAWVGTPFAWDGRTRAGVDCWGLVWRFYFDVLGVRLPDWSCGDRGLAFAQAIADALFAEQVRDHWRAFDQPRDFAIVLCPQGRQAAHVGVFWRGGVLHCRRGKGALWEALGRFRQGHPDCQFGEYVEDPNGGEQ